MAGRPRKQEWPSKASLKRLCSQKRLSEVADYYGRSVGWVAYVRKVYGLTNRRPRSLRTYDEPPLEGDLFDVFLGSMLGDGGLLLDKHGRVFFQESHSVAQKGYLHWKHEKWGARAHRIRRSVPRRKLAGRLIQGREQWGFSTRPGAQLEPWERLFYGWKAKGRRCKKFPMEIVKFITVFAVAVWYMDDGAVVGGRPGFACHRRSHDVARAVLRKFDLEFKASSDRKALRPIDQENAARLLDLVEPYMHPDLLYKMDPPCMRNDPRRRVEVNPNLLRRMVNEGGTVTDIVQELDWGRRFTKDRLKEYGIEACRKRDARPPSFWVGPDLAHLVKRVLTGRGRRLVIPEQVLRELVAEGESVRAMGTRLGVSSSKVAKTLRELGIVYNFHKDGKIRRRKERLDVEKLHSLVAQELPQHEIARRLRSTVGAVQGALKRHGLKTSHRPLKRESATHGPREEPQEEWKDVPGFPGYRVSTEGRVMSMRRRKPRVLGGGMHRCGYRFVTLMVTENGRARMVPKTVSHLVLETFVGPREPGQEARHVNNEPTDDRLANLVWGSKEGEHRRRSRWRRRRGGANPISPGSGRAQRGMEKATAKLTETDVRAIRSATGRLKDLAIQHGVSLSTIHSVKSRRTWKHVE